MESRKSRTQKHRQRIQNALKNNPNISISQLWKKYDSSLKWLLKFDKEWLNSHKPSKKILELIGKQGTKNFCN